jgi:hypothetical protein
MGGGEGLWPSLRYPDIFVERLRTTTIDFSNDNWFP